MNRLIAILFLIIPLSSYGTIQINTTRVIFEESENEQTIEVNNVGKKTALVQIWLSQDDINEKMKETGFIITQPVFKIKPEKTKVVRVIGTDEIKKLYPNDRETMLWVNVLDIPPNSEKTSNKLNIAIHTRIKFFYIPDQIDTTRQEASEKLIWTVENIGNDSYLVAKNNSPIYVNLGKLTIKNNISIDLDSSTVPPFGETKFKLVNRIATPRNINVQYSYIDDLGAYIPKEITIK